MEVTKKIHGVWILFKVSGKIDANSAPELDKEVLPEIDKKLDLVFDMRDVTYISSMGIRSLTLYVKKTYDVYHHVAICNLSNDVRTTIEHTGLNYLLDIYNDLSDIPFAHDVIIPE